MAPEPCLKGSISIMPGGLSLTLSVTPLSRPPPPLKGSISIMRDALQRGSDMTTAFQSGCPGHGWIFGVDNLRSRLLVGSSAASVDRWQPLVPLLIRSFQLARDILLALPLNDHVALKNELYVTGLQTTLRLLTCFKGGTTGQVWRFRCGLEVMKLALVPEGAVQRNRSLRNSMELPLLNTAVHCMQSSVGGWVCNIQVLSTVWDSVPAYVCGF